MTEQMRSIRENLNAPSELVDAVAAGEPYRRTSQRGDSKRRHVKRFSAAIAAYACTALLVVGAVMLLPRLIERTPADSQSDLPPISSRPTTPAPDPTTTPSVTTPPETTPPETTSPVDEPEEPALPKNSPEALYEALASGRDLTVSAWRYMIEDGSMTDERTIVFERDGNKLRYTEQPEDGEETVRYLDMETGLEYYADEGGWLAKGSYYTDWDWVLRDYIFGVDPAFMFDSGNYTLERYRIEPGEYHSLSDEASAELGAELLKNWEYAEIFGEPIIAGISIEYYDDVISESWQIIKTISESGGDHTEGVIYRVTFGDTEVTLPDERTDDAIDTNALLSPSQFGDLLYSDRDMTVRFESGSFRRTLVRDGDKVRVESPHYVGEQVYFLPTAYIDLGADRVYTEDDEWDVKSQQPDWRSVVDAGIFGEVWESFSAFGSYVEVMFSDVNFTLEDGRYAATEAFKQQCYEAGKADCAAGDEYFVEWYGENPTYEIAFTYENGVHEFSYRFYTTDGELVNEMTLALTFGDRTVDLPEAERTDANPFADWFVDQSVGDTYIFTKYYHQAEGVRYLGGAMSAYPYENFEKVDQIIGLLTALQAERLSEGYTVEDGDLLYVLLSDAQPTRDKYDLDFTLQGRYLTFGENACYRIAQSDADRLAELLTYAYGTDRSFDLLHGLLNDDTYGGLKELSLAAEGEELYVGLPRRHFDQVEALGEHLTSVDRALTDWRRATAEVLPTETNGRLSIVFRYNSVEAREPLTVTLYGRLLRVNDYDDLQWFELSQADADRLVSLAQAIVDAAG